MSYYKTMNGEVETREQRFDRFTTACLTENLSAEDFNIKDTYAILGCLTNMPNTKINSARSNHSKLDRDGMTFHLIKLCMRLFVAGLHTETPCDANGFPAPEYNFRTRFLEKRLREPMEESRRLQKQINRLEASDDKVQLRNLREKVLDYESEINVKKEHIRKIEESLKFKEDQLKGAVSKKHLEGVMKEVEALREFNKTET